jgi:tRNA (cytidine/uridine-2'-O-)-methyltransferase
MDYIEMAALTRHDGWEEFEAWRKAEQPPPGADDHEIRQLPYIDDTVQTLSRPGCGAVRPRKRRRTAKGSMMPPILRLTIPMIEGRRSLNLAMSVAMVAGEINRRFGL